MTDSPTLTVLMPTYNEIDGIKESIKSVLNQTFTDFELIVVDGGSNDGTVEYICDIDDSRIQLYCEDEPQGISHALNKGIRKGEGKYVARMDADDRSLPERFERQVSLLNRFSNIQLVTCWNHVIGRNGEKITTNQVDPDRPFDVEDLLKHGPGFAHGSIMVRREVLASVNGYRPPFDMAEDLDLWLRMSEHMGGESFHVIPEVLYERRLSADQMARRTHQRVVTKYVKKAAKCRRQGKKEPIEEVMKEADSEAIATFSHAEHEAMYQYLVGVAHLQAGEIGQARSQFARSISKYPLAVQPWYKLGISFFPRSLQIPLQRVVQDVIDRT